MEELLENIMNVNKDIDEHEIITNIEKLNEMKAGLKMKLMYQKRKKEIMDLQKAKPEEFILKNTDHYRVITERLNDFEYIFQNKIPKTDNDEMNKHVGLTCKDLYEKQLNKLKLDYNEVLKQQTGKYLSEFKDIPEKYKFRGEVILQTSFFPVYYYLKPLLDSMSNIINNQEMILIKVLESIDDINERLDTLSSNETEFVITPEMEQLIEEHSTEEELEEELLSKQMIEHLNKIKEEIVDNMDNKMEVLSGIEKNISDDEVDDNKIEDDSYKIASAESIFNQFEENEKSKEMMNERIDKMRDIAQEKLKKRLEKRNNKSQHHTEATTTTENIDYTTISTDDSVNITFDIKE
jgi:hypothetical protein